MPRVGATRQNLPHVHCHHSFGDIDGDIERLVRVIQVADLVSVKLLRTRVWDGLPPPELVTKLEESCTYEEWPRLPFNAQAFAARLPSTISDAKQMVQALGL